VVTESREMAIGEAVALALFDVQGVVEVLLGRGMAWSRLCWDGDGAGPSDRVGQTPNPGFRPFTVQTAARPLIRRRSVETWARCARGVGDHEYR
jgi:hypothetical protein